MRLNPKELLHFYYKTLLFRQPKKLSGNEIAEFCFFHEDDNQLSLTHYWLRHIYWPLNLSIMFAGLFLYMGITNQKFFDFDIDSRSSVESLMALSILFFLIISWGIIALVGRTTLVLTPYKLIILERPFSFLNSKYKPSEIKSFEIFFKYRQVAEPGAPDFAEVYWFISLITINGEKNKILTFRSKEDSNRVCEKLNTFLIKTRT